MLPWGGSARPLRLHTIPKGRAGRVRGSQPPPLMVARRCHMEHYTEGNTPQACPACGNVNNAERFLWQYGPHPQGDPWSVLTCTACGHQVSAGPPLDMVIRPADIRALAKTGAFEVYMDPTSEPS